MGSRAVKGSNAVCSSQGLRLDGLCPLPSPALCLSNAVSLLPSANLGPTRVIDQSQFVFPGSRVAPSQTLLVPVTRAVIFALVFARLSPITKDTSKNSEAMVSDAKMP